MAQAQLPLIENPAVDADAWRRFLVRWSALTTWNIEPGLVKQIGERWSVVARVRGQQRMALHKVSPEACAENLFKAMGGQS